MKHCAECGEWVFFTGRHVCAPAYFVFSRDLHGDDKDEAETVHAYTIEEAVEKFAEKHLNDEGQLTDNGDGEEVLACKHGADKWRRFRVFAELTIRYSSREEESQRFKLPGEKESSRGRRSVD